MQTPVREGCGIPHCRWPILHCSKSGHGHWCLPAGALSSCTLTGVMGQTPNLSTMGALYTKYRIRGIKLRLSYWQTGGAPVFLFAQATSDQGIVGGGDTTPTPTLLFPPSLNSRNNAGVSTVYAKPLPREVVPRPSLCTTPSTKFKVPTPSSKTTWSTLVICKLLLPIFLLVVVIPKDPLEAPGYSSELAALRQLRSLWTTWSPEF